MGAKPARRRGTSPGAGANTLLGRALFLLGVFLHFLLGGLALEDLAVLTHVDIAVLAVLGDVRLVEGLALLRFLRHLADRAALRFLLYGGLHRRRYLLEAHLLLVARRRRRGRPAGAERQREGRRNRNHVLHTPNLLHG